MSDSKDIKKEAEACGCGDACGCGGDGCGCGDDSCGCSNHKNSCGCSDDKNSCNSKKPDDKSTEGSCCSEDGCGCGSDSDDSCCSNKGGCCCSDEGSSQEGECSSCTTKDTKLQSLEDTLKRALADYKNLERRTNIEKESVVTFANMILLERIIPVLDNLESLCKHMPDQGLQMITKQLADVLKDEGLEEIKALNEKFDPYFMEASEVIEGEEHKVLEVINKGFKLKDKVVRPARVKVGGKKG